MFFLFLFFSFFSLSLGHIVRIAKRCGRRMSARDTNKSSPTTKVIVETVQVQVQVAQVLTTIDRTTANNNKKQHQNSCRLIHSLEHNTDQ
mmetsp:Transcript_28590/g.77416  ORF Transcript_28590/g.77416 Transcript_28590/m.77416 type:complete len:90 (-) Transcript_28590:1477-1746(-)